MVKGRFREQRGRSFLGKWICDRAVPGGRFLRGWRPWALGDASQGGWRSSTRGDCDRRPSPRRRRDLLSAGIQGNPIIYHSQGSPYQEELKQADLDRVAGE